MSRAPNPELGKLSVAQKAALAVGGLLLGAAALVGLTALVVPLGTALTLWGAALLLFLALVALRPVATAGLVARPAPCTTVAQAHARFDALAAAEGPEIAPMCRSFLLSHEARRQRVVVLLHGFSNCPASMRDLAPALFAAGHNVLVPRMPGNGMADTSLPSLGTVTAQALVAWADTAIDIAAALGDKVIVCGISGGGVVAGWALAARPEVTEALLIAPSHGLSSFGTTLNGFVMRLLLTLPNLSIWKDPVKRARAEGRPHTMKRQMTRGFAEVMKLGLATRHLLAATPVTAVPGWTGGRLVLLTNAADTAVDAASARQLADAFVAAGADVAQRVIPAACGLGHEIIDPTDPETDPELVTPLLLRYLGAGEEPLCLERPI